MSTGIGFGAAKRNDPRPTEEFRSDPSAAGQARRKPSQNPQEQTRASCFAGIGYSLAYTRMYPIPPHLLAVITNSKPESNLRKSPEDSWRKWEEKNANRYNHADPAW